MRITLFSVVVDTGEVVLARRDGVLHRQLTAGRHPRSLRERYRAIDLTERLTMLGVQEIPTAEGINVKVGATLRWRVTDAVAYVEHTRHPDELVYLEAQLALRAILSELPMDAVNRAPHGDKALTAAAVAQVNEAVAAVGVTASALSVRDVIWPAEVRQANLDLLTARTRGAAKLEEARAETAAVRSLANAARVLDASPALAQLRLIQSAPYGTQLRLALSPTVTTVAGSTAPNAD